MPNNRQQLTSRATTTYAVPLPFLASIRKNIHLNRLPLTLTAVCATSTIILRNQLEPLLVIEPKTTLPAD
ncbi:MAG: hypothetical protein FWB84_08075 [Candidatus Bathyarchaeota archaeon]|uniref:hypothetical protein n=1 Tax=Candidatus Bathycorpusculum sp. TaxID=2994959 RepID=UPI002838900C|nr:hypothetical protein [Candidatus Termiticorpusculum sp.]